MPRRLTSLSQNTRSRIARLHLRARRRASRVAYRVMGRVHSVFRRFRRTLDENDSVDDDGDMFIEQQATLPHRFDNLTMRDTIMIPRGAIIDDQSNWIHVRHPIWAHGYVTPYRTFAVDYSLQGYKTHRVEFLPVKPIVSVRRRFAAFRRSVWYVATAHFDSGATDICLGGVRFAAFDDCLPLSVTLVVFYHVPGSLEYHVIDAEGMARVIGKTEEESGAAIVQELDQDM